MRSSKVLFTRPTDLSNFTEDGIMNNTIVHESMKMRRLRRAVEVSADMFLKNGFDSVKMSDIADESGVGVATLYRYFGTKTGIVIASMTHLWNKLNEMFSGVFESSVFVSQTGLKQVKDLMRMYIVLFEAHKDFMRLLGEFDLMIIKDDVPRNQLSEYEKSIMNFFETYDAACKIGIADGTIRDDIDLKLFYLSYGHALMELTKKLIKGEVLPSDNFSEGSRELEMLIDTAVEYLRKR